MNLDDLKNLKNEMNIIQEKNIFEIQISGYLYKKTSSFTSWKKLFFVVKNSHDIIFPEVRGVQLLDARSYCPWRRNVWEGTQTLQKGMRKSRYHFRHEATSALWETQRTQETQDKRSQAEKDEAGQILKYKKQLWCAHVRMVNVGGILKRFGCRLF